jgi:hypothetical protein
MRRLILLAALVVPSVAFAQYDGPTIQKIQEEINLNQTRADALNPIIARDTQARNDTAADAAQLENASRGMRNRANEFRGFASRMPPNPQRDNLMQMAGQLDGYAMHNDQLAASQRDISNRLNGLIGMMVQGRNHHLEAANRMRAWLSAVQGGGY